jgi:hypothetical protein
LIDLADGVVHLDKFQDQIVQGFVIHGTPIPIYLAQLLNVCRHRSLDIVGIKLGCWRLGRRSLQGGAQEKQASPEQLAAMAFDWKIITRNKRA